MRRKRVLVVDDEPAVRAAIRQHLRLMGYEVVEAHSAETAWACLETEVPDLVLLDVLLGETHGWDLLSRIRADVRYTKLPIIMVSALGDPHHIEESKTRGANDHIQKPFDPHHLIQVVSENINQGST
jgi:DNA-binding response OmpR family regulator